MATDRTTQAGGARRRATRAALPAVVAALLLVVPGPPTASARPDGTASVMDIRLDNGGSPFDGDRRLLTTITPNGDGLRDRAAIHFRLASPARVRLEVATVPAQVPVLVTTRTVSLPSGSATLYWTPPAGVEPRTYIVLLTVDGHTYGATRSGELGRVETPVVRVQGVDAAFGRTSYRPGASARLTVATDAESLSLQLFRTGPAVEPRVTNKDLYGEPVTTPVEIDWHTHRSSAGHVDVAVGDWPSGLYFAKLTALDGRAGYAPFIVRPRRIGEHRAAVVLPTNTWQAYNHEDENGDGWGDTWYATWSRSATVRLNRHFVGWGIPPCFRRYDLDFLHWLYSGHKQVDYLSDDDLAAVRSARALSEAYDVVVFPGHHEYVTRREYRLMRGYRDLGGNLMYLSANNFFWHITKRGDVLRRTAEWRDLGEPEAGLIGDQYRANDGGGHRGPWKVVDPLRWLFKGTGLQKGSTFGSGGIEIDERSPASPRGTRVIAAIPNLLGPGLTAEMTYYETPRGAKVFSAGAFTLAGEATLPDVQPLLENLWTHMARP